MPDFFNGSKMVYFALLQIGRHSAGNERDAAFLSSAKN
jgi:hypothetical protein